MLNFRKHKPSSITSINPAIIKPYPPKYPKCFKAGTNLEIIPPAKTSKESTTSLKIHSSMINFMSMLLTTTFVVMMSPINTLWTKGPVNISIPNSSDQESEYGSTREMLMPMFPSLAPSDGSKCSKIKKDSMSSNPGENGGLQDFTSMKTKWEATFGNSED